MGLIDEVSGLKIALDTSVFIYFLESHPEYAPIVTPIFKAADCRSLQLCMSVITLLEVLVVPYRQGRQDLVTAYETILEQSDSIRLIPISADLSRQAAQLRALYGIRTPDALQIAAGIIAQADVFLTNDQRLKSVSEISVKVLKDYRI
jgi:predicted nucleic acid-binding protein